jgi:hypothetical protein
MLRIRVNELSLEDRGKLRAEVVTLLLREMTYPPIMDYRAGATRVRPPSVADRERAETFVATSRLDDANATEITSSVLAATVADVLTQYHAAVTPTYADVQRRTMPLRLGAPRLAADVQRRLVAYVLDGAQNGFGAPPRKLSWQDSSNAAPLAPPWESIAKRTVTLAQALAELRDEAPAIAARPVTPSVADSDTERLPSVARDLLPDVVAAARHQPTAPLPRPVEIALSPDQQRADRAIFTQLRQQLLASMAAASANYGINAPADDPAGLLAALRRHDVIDDADLRLAEGILALCARVIAAERVSVVDFRQALTLYLLFNRGRLGQR